MIKIILARHCQTEILASGDAGQHRKGRESVDMGSARTMSYLYNFFDVYNSIVVVAHKSINSTILMSFLNMDFEEAESYFKNTGEVLVLRRNWMTGDKIWHIADKFVPEQS